jgi:hypothetical protein
MILILALINVQQDIIKIKIFVENVKYINNLIIKFDN